MDGLITPPMSGARLREFAIAAFRGEVTRDAAVNEAVSDGVVTGVTADDVAVLATQLADLAKQGYLSGALPAMRLVRDCAWATGDVETSIIGSMRLLTVLHTAIMRSPDGNYLGEAIREHSAALDLLRHPAPSWCLGGVHSEFGRLVVDAYTLGGAQGPREAIEERARLLSLAGDRVPEAHEMLRAAADALFAAAETYPEGIDGDRAAAWKAAAEALVALRSLGVQLRLGEDPLALGLAALAAAPEIDVDVRLGCVQLVRSLGVEADGTNATTELAMPVEDLAAQIGTDRAMGALIGACTLLGQTDVEAALDKLASGHPLMTVSSPGVRRAALSTEISLLTRISPDRGDEAEVDDGEGAAGLQRRAAALGWAPFQLAGALIAAATKTPRGDVELLGLGLLDLAEQTDPQLCELHGPALRLLRAVLELGEGENQFRSGQWAAAAVHYANSFAHLVRLDLPGLWRPVLGNVVDATAHMDAADAIQMLAVLAPIVGRFEIRAGTDDILWVQRAFRNVGAAMSTRQPVNSELLWALDCLAKGARLASALRTGARFNAAIDAPELLARVNALDAEMATSAVEPEDNTEAEIALMAWSGHDGLLGGIAPDERLRNARRLFDIRMSEQLLRPTTLWESLGAVQEGLDARTVVVDWYLGAAPDGTAVVRVLLFTRDRIDAGLIPYSRSADPVSLQDSDLEVIMSPFADEPLTRRLLVQEFPLEDDEVLVEEAIPAFEAAPTELLGGNVLKVLAQHRQAGRDHLCLLPHGPLHFDPVHLFGPVDRPLADDWIITAVPNQALLTPRVRPAAEARQTILSVGIKSAFAERHQLRELQQAEDEAAQIAHCFGAAPILGPAARKSRVLNAMREARFVHLATHGEHCPGAPAFHRLFLAEDDDCDGSLFAYELLDIDLSNVELLTLGACQSALGRVDPADNLTGLPAAFFLAGVRAIIGTLWPVSSAASSEFFSCLYRGLSDQMDPLDAFATAQRRTRTAYPRYCQWGAFMYLGDWRT